jgi:hypothetical protein
MGEGRKEGRKKLRTEDGGKREETMKDERKERVRKKTGSTFVHRYLVVQFPEGKKMTQKGRRRRKMDE